MRYADVYSIYIDRWIERELDKREQDRQTYRYRYDQMYMIREKQTDKR